VPPSALISTTFTASAIEKVSATVTYETNTAWMPPAKPASAHEMAKAASLKR
jgi:hypothetical protein